MSLPPEIQQALQRGLVIPACPLALNAGLKLDERRQRALLRYYVAAGAGGVATGVHTTQFAIRDPSCDLFEPVLQLTAEELARADTGRREPLVRIGGICGDTSQATREAALLRELGYHAGLLSLAAMKGAGDDQLIAHCHAVAEILPMVGFYLQPAVGGRVLPFAFWRRFVEIESVVAIKIAPFNRYQTLEVVRAVAEAGRDDIAPPVNDFHPDRTGQVLPVAVGEHDLFSRAEIVQRFHRDEAEVQTPVLELQELMVAEVVEGRELGFARQSRVPRPGRRRIAFTGWQQKQV